MWLHPKSDPLKEKPWWMIANPPSSPKYSKKKKEKKKFKAIMGMNQARPIIMFIKERNSSIE